MDKHTVISLSQKYPLSLQLLTAQQLLKLVFGDSVDIFDENGVFYVGNFEKADGGISGKGKVFYLSGVVVDGTFLHGLPHGVGVITHPASGVKEKVTFVNGCRASSEDQPSLITFGNGYQMKAMVEDLSPQLFQRTIPYIRNFYHASYFDMGKPYLTILSSQEGILNPLPSEVALWSVQYFDTQQPSMVVNLSNPSMLPLQDYCSDDWFSSEESNCVQSITLICHSFAKKNIFNYMMTENSRYRHLNQFMMESVHNAHCCVLSENEVKTYGSNFKSVMKVLEKSSKLHSLEVIAFPFTSFLMKDFEYIWKKLKQWVFKRR